MKTLTKSTIIALICSLMSMLVSTTFAASAPNYVVTKTIPLGAPDRWDYLTYDSHAHRLYVAHGDRITVVDMKSGTVLGQVEGMPGGTHGIGIASRLNRGLTDDGGAGSVAVFDLATLKVTKTLATDKDADGIVFDPSSGHYLVINGDSGTISVIDPKKEKVVATVSVGCKLEFGAVDNHGKLYVNGAENKEIVQIDTHTNQVEARWPVPNCTSPHGMAIDPVLHRLFSSCVNNVLVVLDTSNGSTVATLPIGSGTDAAVFDPKRKLIFSSNGRDGTLTVIKENNAQSYEVVATINTAVTARTMALDTDTGQLFLAAGDVDIASVTPKGRPHVVPGSLKILVMDPAP